MPESQNESSQNEPNAHDRLAANSELHAIQDSMLDGLGQLASYFGFNKVIGQLYAYVLFEPNPRSLDQLRARLGISKAGVSMHMRTLEQLGMVRQVYVRGEHQRRKFYEAETDLWQITRNILSVREKRDIDRTLTVLQEKVDRLLQIQNEQREMDSDTHTRAKYFLERIEQLEALFNFARLLITSMLDETELTTELTKPLQE